MYCRHCGQKISENAKFCGKCGEKVDVVRTDEPSPVTEEPGDIQQPADTQEPDNDKTPRKGKLWWKIVLIIVICAAAVVVCLFGWYEMRERQYRNHLDVAQTYINEKDYDEAIEELRAAIDIDPQVVEPYIQLADAYKELGNTEMVEGTIDAGRRMIVDTYERKGELPEDTERLYYNAVEEAIENGDIDRAGEISEEYTNMGGDSDDLPPIPNPDPDSKTTSDSEPPSEETVLEMLDLFAYWMDYHLYDWYTTDERYHNEETVAEFSAYEDIGMAQACAIAGRILGDQGNYEYAHDFESYCYVDGKMIPWDEVSEESRFTGGAYGRLSTAQLDEYLSDLFGMTYNAEDFAEHADELGNEVKQDEEGQMYTSLGVYEEVEVDVSIENIADTPDEDGTYKVLARYDEFYEFFEFDEFYDNDTPEDTYYVQFRFKPDEDSKYGYVIVGMVPAGCGEIDPEFLPESSTEDTDDEEDAITEGVDWQNLYADYIEENYSMDSSNENAYVYLLYLNNDDTPEVLLSGFLNNYYYANPSILYIRDNQVDVLYLERVSTVYVREGYIVGELERQGEADYSILFLNDENEFVSEFDGSYAYGGFDGSGIEEPHNFIVNEQSVTEDEYYGLLEEKTTLGPDENYTVIYTDYGGVSATVVREGTPVEDEESVLFANNAYYAVKKLRSGDTNTIIG